LKQLLQLETKVRRNGSLSTLQCGTHMCRLSLLFFKSTSEICTRHIIDLTRG